MIASNPPIKRIPKEKSNDALIEISGTVKGNITSKEAKDLMSAIKKLGFKGYGFIATGEEAKTSKAELRLKACLNLKK